MQLADQNRAEVNTPHPPSHRLEPHIVPHEGFAHKPPPSSPAYFSVAVARREYFYNDETDLMAIRVDGWKMHIGVKPEGSWWDEKYYPSVPYVFNLVMDPMEKMDPQSKEWGYIGRKFFAQKMWAPAAAGPFLGEHLKSLQDYPPRQGADSLSMKKVIEGAMKKMDSPAGGSN